MAGLPASLKAMAELTPVEDMMLAVLREKFAPVQVKTLIEQHQTWPLILVRRAPDFGEWSGDPRFMDVAQVYVYTFCEDPDGDQDAAILAEAVRIALRDAALEQKVHPGIGHLTKAELTAAPRRVSDWATASGPVQYADLPTGVWRYETQYRVAVRKSRSRPYPNP